MARPQSHRIIPSLLSVGKVWANCALLCHNSVHASIARQFARGEEIDAAQCVSHIPVKYQLNDFDFFGK